MFRSCFREGNNVSRWDPLPFSLSARRVALSWRGQGNLNKTANKITIKCWTTLPCAIQTAIILIYRIFPQPTLAMSILLIIFWKLAGGASSKQRKRYISGKVLFWPLIKSSLNNRFPASDSPKGAHLPGCINTISTLFQTVTVL